MNYNLVLPLLALVFAVLAAFVPLSSAGDSPPPSAPIKTGAIVAAIVVLLFGGATLLWPATLMDGSFVTLALALGSLAAILAVSVGRGRAAFAVGVAVVGAS